MATIIKDIATKVKNNAVKSIGNAMFGSGIIGGALNKAFQKKFGDKEESDTQVAEALSEQEKVQDQNNATLTRIETIVVNIADNIYNIAGVLNTQVVSMKEAQRLQQERAYKNAAAEEERNAEALKLEAPTPAASAPIEQTSNDKGGGGIMALAGLLLSTRKMFKGFLKKFAIFAAGVTAVGLAGAATTSLFSGGDKQPPLEPPQASKEAQAPLPSTGAGGGRGGQGGTSFSDTEQPTNQTSAEAPDLLPPTGAGGGRGSQGMPTADTSAPSVESTLTTSATSFAQNTSSGGNAPGADSTNQATLVTPSTPSLPAAEPVSAPFVSTSKINDKAESDPKAAHEFLVNSNQVKVQPQADGSFIDVLSGKPIPEEQVKQKIQAAGKNPEKVITQAKKYQEKANKPQTFSSASPAPSSAAAAGGAMPAPMAMPAPSTGGTSGSVGSSSSGSGASPVAPSPSTGASIGQTSTAVAAASENIPPKLLSSQINNNTSLGGVPAPTSIPSPIANRGSLDIGTVFNSNV